MIHIQCLGLLGKEQGEVFSRKMHRGVLGSYEYRCKGLPFPGGSALCFLVPSYLVTLLNKVFKFHVSGYHQRYSRYWGKIGPGIFILSLTHKFQTNNHNIHGSSFWSKPTHAVLMISGSTTLNITERGFPAQGHLGSWEPRTIIKSYYATNLTQEIYWGETQNHGCLWTGRWQPVRLTGRLL